MIDLTPLDVRSKRGDFKKLLRGYDPQEVDTFLEIVAERLEMLVRENIQLRERAETLQLQVSSQSGRERAVQEALVTAQELRTEMRTHAERQSDLILGEAQAEARRQLAEAEAEIRTRFREVERRMEQARDALEEMERRRTRFLRSFRQLLEREMDVVSVEEERPPLEERPIEMELGGGRRENEDVEDEEFGSLPPLDANVDNLREEYRRDGGALFEDAPNAGDADAADRDLFSAPRERENDDLSRN